MILYVNGDSHTAAAEAVNTFAFAEDDPGLIYLGRLPHPDNLAVSWGKCLSDIIKATFRCDAESAGSNDRIIRTTKQWLDSTLRDPSEMLMIIQWSTWERQEWLIDGTWFQVNASGTDYVPDEHRERYKRYVADVDWRKCTELAHARIWDFHQYLSERGIKHVFFNGNNDFSKINDDQKRDWGASYIGPYDPKMTYNQWLLDNGYETVSPNSYHFGRDAHIFWAKFMLKYIVSNKLI